MRISEIYSEFGALVMRRALTILKSESDAEEVLHEVFCILMESKLAFPNKRALVAWLYRSTTTRSLNMIRNRTRRGDLLKQHKQELRGTQSANVDDILFTRVVLSQLPTQLAAAGVLYYVSGLTHGEIGEVLDISRRTACNLVLRFVKEARKMTENGHESAK